MITKWSPVARCAPRRSPMRESADPPRWTRHFFYRTERTRTTWKLRVGLVTLVLVVAWLTHGWWTVAVARSLVCESNRAPSDAILIENFDPDYLRVRACEKSASGWSCGASARASPGQIQTRPQPRAVELATAEMMANLARLGAFDVVPIREVEPISLNAARDVLRYVEREHIHSVIVVIAALPQQAIRARLRCHARPCRDCGRCEPVEGRPWSGHLDDELARRPGSGGAVAQVGVLQTVRIAVPARCAGNERLTYTRSDWHRDRPCRGAVSVTRLRLPRNGERKTRLAGSSLAGLGPPRNDTQQVFAAPKPTSASAAVAGRRDSIMTCSVARMFKCASSGETRQSRTVTGTISVPRPSLTVLPVEFGLPCRRSIVFLVENVHLLIF